MLILNSAQLSIAHQALNECLHGFGMKAAGEVDCNREDGRRLMVRLRQGSERRPESFELGSAEARAIASALDATFRELDWDYETRMGVDIAEAKSLRAMLLPDAEEHE